MLGHYDSTNGYADSKNSATLQTIARWLRLLCGDSLQDTTNLPWLTPYKCTKVPMTSSGHITSTSSNYEAVSSANNAAAASSANKAAAVSSATTVTAASSANSAAAASSANTVAAASSVSTTAAASTANSNAAEAAANANNPVLKQGDCPPADAGSSVNAAQANAAGSAAQTNANPSAANSTAADAATARLKESPAAGSQQGDYSATDALASPVAAQINPQYAEGFTDADQNAATSLAAHAATARLKESPTARSQQGDYSATDALCLPVAAKIARLKESPSAVSSSHQSAVSSSQSAVSSSHQSAVSSGHQSADTHPLSAASQQGDCTRNSAVGGAGDATAAQNAQDTAAARNDPAADSLAATAATARLMESAPSGSDAYINVGSIIRLLFYRSKFSVYDRGKSGLKFGMFSASLSYVF